MDEPIEVNVFGFQGFAVLPSISRREGRKIIERLKAKDKVAFIDLAPTREMMLFLRRLEEAGVEIMAYFDHHVNPQDGDLMVNVRKIRQNLKGMAVLKTRHEAWSCPGLIEEGEWEMLGLEVIFFHADSDGFLAFLKGCRLVYPELEADADIFEGRSGTQSWLGKLLGDAQNNLPPYFLQNPVQHRKTLGRIYQTLANYLVSSGEISLDDFEAEVFEATKKAEELGVELASKAELLPGKVVYANCLGAIRDDKVINFSKLQAEIIRLHGSVLICTVGKSLAGDTVRIRLPKAWDKLRIDLQEFMPTKGPRSPLRMTQIGLDQFPGFLKKWQERFPEGPE